MSTVDRERELLGILRAARKNLQQTPCCEDYGCPCPVNVVRQNINRALGDVHYPTSFTWKDYGDGDHEAHVAEGFTLSVMSNDPHSSYVWFVTRFGPAEDLETGKREAERVAQGQG